jgi:hypothetical protein
MGREVIQKHYIADDGTRHSSRAKMLAYEQASKNPDSIKFVETFSTASPTYRAELDDVESETDPKKRKKLEARAARTLANVKRFYFDFLLMAGNHGMTVIDASSLDEAPGLSDEDAEILEALNSVPEFKAQVKDAIAQYRAANQAA